MKRWGEYVAVVGTAVFIPLEVYEILEKVTWLRIVAFAFQRLRLSTSCGPSGCSASAAARRPSRPSGTASRCWSSRRPPTPNLPRQLPKGWSQPFRSAAGSGPALGRRHELERAVAGVDLLGPGDLLLLVLHELQPLREPARRTADGEEHGEHLGREREGLIDQAGVEVDVRVEIAGHEVVVLERDLLQLLGDLEERVDSGDLEDVVAGLFDDRGARVVVLVDPVAEAHQPLVAVLDALDEVGDVLLRPDPAQHPHYRLVGATVQRAIERRDAGRHRGVGVDLARAHGAYGVGRAVLLVVGVQDEQHVERLDQTRVGVELLLA